ncbi:MAG TPA: alpha/beta fold hydrolase [Gammaproteobacteria bacterium]|nr:alpha/beta fold hydrolase [Gammaproteobacteria bacterium]
MADPAIAAIAGWGHGPAAWEPLAGTGLEFAARALPGLAPGDSVAPADCTLTAAAERLAGDWDLLLGWSLGGLAAVEAIRQGIARARGLVLIGTPATFLAGADHPAGLDPEVLADFRTGLAAAPHKTLRRFYALQFQGDTAPRATWAGGRDHFLATAAEPAVLAGWLEVLAAADLRAEPPALPLPVLALHGAADPIVDPAAADFLAGCSPAGQAQLVAGAGHAPHIAHAEETGKRIAEFAHQLPR